MRQQKQRKTFKVVIYRENGRFLRQFTNLSKYAAKHKADRLEAIYDSAYKVVVEPESDAIS